MFAEAPFGGCVSIDNGSCGKTVRKMGNEGTRGSVLATPLSGNKFVRWAQGSSDCTGETTNPCSFAYDRNKAMVALFESSSPSPSSPPVAAPAPSPAPRPKFEVTVQARSTSVDTAHTIYRGCVIIDNSACERVVRRIEHEGTRGQAYAVPRAGSKFLGWASYSSDCPGETTNPCSFTYDRSKGLTALFD